MLENVKQKGCLRRGFKTEVEDLARDFPHMRLSLKDVKKDLTDYFLACPEEHLGLTDKKLAFFHQLLSSRSEESLLETPRVTIGTIHSVKGMEADWVAILPDMTRRTAEGAAITPEDEARVWYVAATRARQGVILVPGRTPYRWSWPNLN